MDSPLSSVLVVRLLAEDNRRKVVAALVLADGPASLSQVVEVSGLDLRAVIDALDRLVSGGLVELDGESYSLMAQVFQQAARAEAPEKPESVHADQPVEVARVLDVAFKDGKLVQWPSKQAKRRIVLDHLAQHFEIGKRYTEQDVNDTLRRFNDDVATTRRYLVDEEFLDRSAGQYWRCGGTI